MLSREKISMMNLFRSKMIVMLGMCVLFSGCGLIQNRSNQYQASQNGPDLKIPSKINNKNTKLSKKYRIPKNKETNKNIAVSDVPPGENLTVNNTKSTTINNAVEPELFINNPPRQVWLAILPALKRQRVPIIKINNKKWYYQIADSYVTNYQLAPNTPQYKIMVKPAKSGTQLIIRDLNNKPINTYRAKRLLQTVSKGVAGKNRWRSFNEILQSALTK